MELKAILVDLEPRDATILDGISALQRMHAKIESGIVLYEALEEILKGTIFGATDGNGRHEIKLDEQHSIVCTLKDGEFSWEQTCNCDHEHEAGKTDAHPQ